MMRRFAGFLFALVLCGWLNSPAAAEDKTLTVFAAASMKNALDDIDAAFTARTGVKVSASYAASSTLAKQIEQAHPRMFSFPPIPTGWTMRRRGKTSMERAASICSATASC